METIVIDISNIYVCPAQKPNTKPITKTNIKTPQLPKQEEEKEQQHNTPHPSPEPEVILYNPSWTKSFSEVEYHSSWKPMFNRLKDTLLITETKIFEDLNIYGSSIKFYPEEQNIFNAFNTPLTNLCVIILGQDCYHEEGQAHGLSFSVPTGIPIPPSLMNIYKELSTDIPEFKIPKTGNLTKWTKQGVLLLNCALSVMQGQAGVHLKYWKPFTDKVIEYISLNKKNLIFLLWGSFAQSKKKLICETNGHIILEANHPSPLSANRSGWFGCKHFSRVNKELEKIGKNKINWQL